MENDLLRVALRYSAIFLPQSELNVSSEKNLRLQTELLLVNLRNLGYSVSEKALQKLDETTERHQKIIFDTLKEILGVDSNWAPLVKDWKNPTGETREDHLITYFANIYGATDGTVLPCGHLIPPNTFKLERYNGCPFCGTPFEFGKIEKFGQNSKCKILEYWDEARLQVLFKSLLESKTALDATQADSVKLLLKHFEVPQEVDVSMKETQILIVEALVDKGQAERADEYFSTPNDVMRFLWYKHTGELMIVQPKTMVERYKKNKTHHSLHPLWNDMIKNATSDQIKGKLKLKYSRKECRMVATWLNNLNLNGSVEQTCESMHPKRGMWVRFIRALRLPEYAKKKGFSNLKTLLDIFYREDYQVWQGLVDDARKRDDAKATFQLLKEHPGVFARSLFANMIQFSSEITLAEFEKIMHKVPARLIITLNMYADLYFNPTYARVVKPLGGNNKNIGVNPLIQDKNKDELQKMKDGVENLCLKLIKLRFEGAKTNSKSMYIEPQLYNIPLSIGDRSQTVQDLNATLMGTRIPVEGSFVRLFMQWGKGLPAQHLDMDLSCNIVYDTEVVPCSYYNLSPVGAYHSGDIRSIPDEIGTAEYIELDFNKLKENGARYVIFTCNAYSMGGISPNLVLGWMNGRDIMDVSEQTGVAYDPSCVQHQVKVVKDVSKGLVFGVLEIESKQIVWLEMEFGGQNIASLDKDGVEAFLKKLSGKMSIGNLLKLKAEAQHLKIKDNAEKADEEYTLEWAKDSAAVTQLFID